MEADGVFAGGGVKAFAFIGALRALEEAGVNLTRVAGTSAGALTAALYMAGYRSDELERTMETFEPSDILEHRKFFSLSPRVLKWVSLYRYLGLYRGDKFEAWLTDLLQKKGVRTFADLPKGSLRMVASDLSYGEFFILPDDLPRYGKSADQFSVAKAVRMSCSLPFLFEPVRLKGGSKYESVIVDGAVLSNFPIWLFSKRDKKEKRPIIGFQLSASNEPLPERKIDNGLEMVPSILQTMQSAHDRQYIAKHEAESIVFIPVKDVSVTDFQLDTKERQELIKLGERKTNEFLSRWP
ncbi:patatin-like phospholipase family protein [Texcoconibacillus texcoconensis]|uniref:NTE family protein n=1 Tax=Texcoconibacillus texcoconensis TaxID=1095777 RepID=A0A840QP25_9BACI|nr:patatin-like phospholipase family protein [Texcoconibacillus texcoconensis]MBB5173091.1 NTE family protein [Texcoconibacillus texcoconensis]